MTWSSPLSAVDEAQAKAQIKRPKPRAMFCGKARAVGQTRRAATHSALPSDPEGRANEGAEVRRSTYFQLRAHRVGVGFGKPANGGVMPRRALENTPFLPPNWMPTSK